MSFILYHYNKQPLDILKSREAQGYVLSKEDRKYEEDRIKVTYFPDIYSRHISLFIDPVPRNLPDLFNHRHNLWKSGTTLYEHEVIVDNDLDKEGRIKFVLTENPWKHVITDSTDFTKQSEVVNYHLKLAAQRAKLGEQGSGVVPLIKLIEKYKGHCNEHFGAYRNEHYWESDILPRYAANVPHLMLYPATGELKVSTIRRFKLK